MSRFRKVTAALALTGSAALTACGPVNFALPGTTASFGPLNPGSFDISYSNCLISGGAFGHRSGINAAAAAGERVQRIQRIAARYSLASSDIRVRQANWRAIAEGGC